MGTWQTKIDGNDTFQDIYQGFYQLYNQGASPQEASAQIKADFVAYWMDEEDRNNALFALVLAQWETKCLEKELLAELKDILTTGKDLEVWKALGACPEQLEERKMVLANFWKKVSVEREKPKRRIKPKWEFKLMQVFLLPAPDGKKVLDVNDEFVNEQYTCTSALLNWQGGGGGVFNYIGEGKDLKAQWLDTQTLEIQHEAEIEFNQKNTSLYFLGDKVQIAYKEIVKDN